MEFFSTMQEVPQQLPDLTLRMRHNQIIIEIGDEYLTIQRSALLAARESNDELPEDIDEESPIA